MTGILLESQVPPIVVHAAAVVAEVAATKVADMAEVMRRVVEGSEAVAHMVKMEVVDMGAEGSMVVAPQEHSVEPGGNPLAAQLARSARTCSYCVCSRSKQKIQKLKSSRAKRKNGEI